MRKMEYNNADTIVQSSVSLRTSAHTGVAISRIFLLFFGFFYSTKTEKAE